MYFHFIALQWSLGLRVICKPLHTTIARLSPFRLVFTVLPGFTTHFVTPHRNAFMYFQFIALQWILGLRAICKPLHTIARLSRLIISVFPGFTINCNTP